MACCLDQRRSKRLCIFYFREWRRSSSHPQRERGQTLHGLVDFRSPSFQASALAHAAGDFQNSRK